MNIAGHVFRKDVRHLRWLLGAWFIMVLLQGALLVTGVAAWKSDTALQVAMGILGMLVPVLKWILLVVLVPLLIQDEPLTGHTAFWLTRPIGRDDVLKSKARFLAWLIVLPPVLAELVTLVYHRVAPADLALALPEMVWEAVLGLLPVVALAVVTSNFARFAIAGVSVYAAAILASFLWQMFRMFTDMEGMMADMAQPTLGSSRSIVVGLLTLLVLGGAIVHQYRTRRTRVTVLMLAAYAVLMVSVNRFWTLDFMAVPGPATPEAAALDGADVHLRSTYVSDVSAMRPGGKKEKQVHAAVDCDRLPPAHFISLKSIDAHLVFSDGQTQDYVSRRSELDYGRSVDERALTSLLSPVAFLSERRNPHVRSSSLLRLPVDCYDQHRFDEAELKAEAVMRLQRYEVLARLPLQVGVDARAGTTDMTISEVLENSGGCTVVLGRRRLFLMFRRQANGGALGERFNPQDLYALVNQRLGEAYLPDHNTDFHFNPFEGQQRLRVDTPRLAFVLKGDDGVVHRSGAEVDDWLRDAELWWIGVRDAGTFRAVLHETAFRLDDRERSGSRVPVDTNALAKLVIPDQPTREQAAELVRQVLHLSRGQNRWRSEDPQVDVLTRVGSENIEVLLQSLNTRDSASFYLVQAIERLAGEAQKPLILSHVRRHPELLQTVRSKGWMADLDPELAKSLRRSDRYGHYFE